MRKDKWDEIVEAVIDGELDPCVARLQKMAPKVIQANMFSLFADLVADECREAASRSTANISDAARKYWQSKMDYFCASLADDHNRLLMLQKANGLLQRAEERHRRDWQEQENMKAGEAVKQWMLTNCQVWVVEKHEMHAGHLSMFQGKIGEANNIGMNNLLTLCMVDFNAPGFKTAGAVKNVLKSIARINDSHTKNNASVIMMPDFAKSSSPHGLITEIRNIEDRLIELAQSCDVRFSLKYERDGYNKGFGRNWVDGRLVVSAGEGFVATIDKDSKSLTQAPVDSPNLWVNTNLVCSMIDGGKASKSSEVVYIEDLGKDAMPNVADKRTPKKSESAAQKGAEVDKNFMRDAIADLAVDVSKHAILLVDFTPHVGDRLLAFLKLRSERGSDQVPIYMIAFTTENKEGQYITARVAHTLAQEWMAGHLHVADEALQKSSGPCPLPLKEIEKIAGASEVVKGWSQTRFSVCTVSGNKIQVSASQIAEFRTAPEEFKGLLDEQIRLHKETYEGMLANGEVQDELSSTSTLSANETLYESEDALKAQTTIQHECESAIPNVFLLMDSMKHVYMVLKDGKQAAPESKTIPMHAHLAGFGAGKYVAKDTPELQLAGAVSIPFDLQAQGDKTVVEYSLAGEGDNAKVGTLYNMIIAGERAFNEKKICYEGSVVGTSSVPMTTCKRGWKHQC